MINIQQYTQLKREKQISDYRNRYEQPRNRVAVKLVRTDSCIMFRVISRANKTSKNNFRHNFYCTANVLLQFNDYIIERDIYSFLKMVIYRAENKVSLDFTWLSSRSDGFVQGFTESLLIPYDKYKEFLLSDKESTMILCELETCNRKLEFNSEKNLSEILKNPALKRKFVKFICSNFNYYDTKKIVFTDDYYPHSFYFRQIKESTNEYGETCERVSMCGGLIFHQPKDVDISKGYFSVHT